MRIRLIALLPLAAVFGSVLMFPDPVLAQAAGCGAVRDVKPQPLDEQTWKRMNDIYEDIGEENYDLASTKLNDLVAREKGSKYLLAIVQQLIGQVEWARENFDKALKGFETAVTMDALPDQTHYSLMYQIAQLYYMQERYDEALKNLNMWFCKVPAEQVKAAAHILKASIYAAKEDWKNVVPSVDAAIALEPEPKESWYLLKLAAHFEMKDLPAARDTLKTIIKFWPNKKSYWIQLSNVYFQLKDDDNALAVAALANRKGLLDKETDYLYLSNLYSFKDIPFKAAQVLEAGIDKGLVQPTDRNWTMIADSWYAAEEMDNALVAYEKAGKAAATGEIDLRRGYILIDQERWEEAKDALSKALEKGGINERKTGEAHLMIGMAEFNLGNYDGASAAWGRASRFDRAKDAAQQWMNHLKEERARKAS